MTHDELVAKFEALTARVLVLESAVRYQSATQLERWKDRSPTPTEAQMDSVEAEPIEALANRRPRGEVVKALGADVRPLLRAMPAALAAEMVRDIAMPVDFVEAVTSEVERRSPSADKSRLRAVALFYRIARHHGVTWADIGVAADGTVTT